MFRNVLVPLDGTPFAEHALPWALSIAGRAGANLDLVHGHALYGLAEPAASWCPYDREADAESKRQEQLYLDGTARRLGSVSPLRTTTALVNAIPPLDAEALLLRVAEVKPDLIVMATHARGPLGRMLLGGTVRELVRLSGVSVLLIRAESDNQPALLPEPFVEDVLAPLDGSKRAEQILAPAADLAALFAASCTLLRVVESPQEEESAVEYLAELRGTWPSEGPRLRTQVEVARHADEAIVEAAQATEGRVIALATHGRGGLAQLLLGSVADKVVRHTHCPVLVYRPAR